MRALYLVRHGETGWNAERRLQGREDVPLSAIGVEQARALRAALAGVVREVPGEVTVVCSPLTRARETCRELGLTPDVVDPDWQEADLGEWTGRTREELVAAGNGHYAAWRAGRFSPPGSEDVGALATRVAAALDRLADRDLVVVVTHGGPIRAVCRQLLGLEPARLVPVQPGSMTVIDLEGPLPRLRSFNLTPPAAQELVEEPPD